MVEVSLPKKPFIDVVVQHIPWNCAKKEGQVGNGKRSDRDELRKERKASNS